MARISRKKGNVNQTGTDVKDIFRTAVYLRLSVEDNGKKDADSLDNQRELLLSYVADRPYLELIEIYEDNGWTGTDFDRPAFQRMLEDAQKGKINCIVVKDLSRLGRNYVEAGNYLEKVFPFLNLRFTDSNLNHTGIYLYSKGKIMIHLTFDYKTDEKCTTPGQYLKYHRTFQGFTTRELAEKVGIVPATLVLYENDRHPIKHSTAVALANALGIDRNRLLDEYTAFVDYPYFSLLKKVRQDLSLTQIQMAELIGIGQTSYSGWEREIRVPRRKEYDKILAALKKLKVNVDTYLCQSASI